MYADTEQNRNPATTMMTVIGMLTTKLPTARSPFGRSPIGLDRGGRHPIAAWEAMSTSDRNHGEAERTP
jgi:hypothetical protein